jgi:surface polysaccharide O-acyltransferase-like enzyme
MPEMAAHLDEQGTHAYRERLAGVDAVRYICVFAVVLIHVLPDTAPTYQITVEDVISEASRFAVPFFFISAGFFLARRDLNNRRATILLIIKRIVPIYVFWDLAYTIGDVHSLEILSNPRFLLHLIATGGSGFHLWFLPTLGLSMALVVITAGYLGWYEIFAVALGLYVIGLIVGSYRGLLFLPAKSTMTWLQIARDGPFFGTIFVLFGLWLAKSRWRARVWTSLALFVAGLALQLTEAYFLDVRHLNYFKDNDLLIGTLFLGPGAFLLALHLPSGSTIVKKLAALGRYSLGIYAVHLYFVFAFQALPMQSGIAERFAGAILVLLASTLFTLALAQVKPVRFLTM